MARSTISFAPSPPTTQSHDVEASSSSSPTKRTFQSTLFNVKFGASRSRLPPTKSEAVAKRTRSHSLLDDSSTDNSTSPKQARIDPPSTTRTPTSAPKYHHRGPFHQVTSPSFCSTYMVPGLPGAEVYYHPNFIDRSLAEEWRQQLDSLPEWYRPKLKVYGREIQQSREIAAYSTAPGLQLKYSGHPVEMHSPFPPLLDRIAGMVSRCVGEEVKFNHCMLNRYDDGKVYIGKHSDNKENKVIVTVSLGADRSWVMERKKKGDAEGVKKKWTLEGGSLLVMQGETQKWYTHEIPKEPKVRGARISITFRQLVYDK